MGEIAINPTHNVHQKYRQMNLVNPYIFAPPVDLSTNTYIGGVASTIGTASTLATKLAIDVSRITNFSIVGSDIKCRITGSYVIPINCFYLDASIKNYLDIENLVTDIGRAAFRDDGNSNMTLSKLQFNGIVNLTPTLPIILGSPITELYLGNCVSISSGSLQSINSKRTARYIYIPKCTSLGSTSASNDVFTSSISTGSVIIAHPSLNTNNAGGMDGDLASAAAQGATIRFKTNETAPNAISNLSVGIIYNTAVQLNFTPLSITNAIDYYECYANGILKNRITASGQYITGLTASTSYNITVVAVDVFYNKSVVSSSLIASTNTTSAQPTTGLVSYYKLDSNSNDNFGSNYGVDTSVTYGVGKIGNGAIFNGSTSKSTINLSNLSSSACSVNFWIKLINHTPTDINKTGIMSLNTESSNSHYPFTDGNIYLGLLTNTRKTIGAGVVTDRAILHMCTITADAVSNVWKFYQNGILVTTSTVGVNPINLLSLSTFGKSKDTYFLNGLLDEISIYNIALTQSQILLIYNNGNGITL